MITIDLDSRQLENGLGKLLKNATNSRPMMRAIATELNSMTEDNFESESWGGERWDSKEKRETMRVGKERRQTGTTGKTLQLSGQLAAGMVSRVGNDFARIGSNKKYAAIHHLGGKTSAHTIRPKKKKVLAFAGRGGDAFARVVNHPGSNIPARPYLPIRGDGKLQRGGEQRILDIALKALSKDL